MPVRIKLSFRYILKIQTRRDSKTFALASEGKVTGPWVIEKWGQKWSGQHHGHNPKGHPQRNSVALIAQYKVVQVLQDDQALLMYVSLLPPILSKRLLEICHCFALIPWIKTHYCLLPLHLPLVFESLLQLLQDLAICLAWSELQVPLPIESLQPWKTVQTFHRLLQISLQKMQKAVKEWA